MKSVLLAFALIFITATLLYAQTGREVHGTIVDSLKQPLPGSTITLTSDQHDSTTTISDVKGKFVFPAVKGDKIVVTISSIGYQAIRKHFSLTGDTSAADLGEIVLMTKSNVLNQVNIVGVIPITLKEDTVQYQASAYKVRENAPVEDLIKKLPGVDVDANGNITAQGKQVTKVRINGKDFMGGDVQSATKNLPADVVENIQMIDDYGDQANLTGVKTGEPDKIMNITIRQDKNYGYFGQATVGDGRDALPQSQGIPDQNRYLGSLNVFNFKGDQQIAVLGSINNTNINTFSFGSTGGGGGGFGRGGFGGGGRGNAARGFADNGSLITTQNGITQAHSIGANFRDQWGKNLSVYGSYSFANNTTTTNSDNFQQQTSPTNPVLQKQNSTETDGNINHRFTWNMEYKPDTVNYLKITPTFSYAGTNTNESESDNFSRYGAVTSAYTGTTEGNSQAPAYGLNVLFNHRFKRRHNLSIYATLNSATSNAYQNPVYDYSVGEPTAPANQMINTDSRTTSYGTTLSYLEPVGKRSYLEFNYAVNRSNTTNNKATDTLFDPVSYLFRSDSALSTQYNYNFTTNKVGVNYRFIEKKYNYTIGVGVQPAVLDGDSPITGLQTHESTLNIIPTARYVYNFSRGRTFAINYSGSSSQPSFAQLQPVTDFSNAQYPVRGNPDLKPQFTNNFTIRYNNFSFASGNVFFTFLHFEQTQNYVATNTITYPRNYKPDSALRNTILTKYLNANGYYNIFGRVTFAKPWNNRKYTLTLNGTINYTNNIGYLTNVDSVTYTETTEENIARNLVFTPEARFRVDITDKIDAQVLTSFAVNRTDNSVQNPLTSATSNIRTWNIGLNGKNYFGDWTFSYDYSKAINYGYTPGVQVTNPNILNLYVERRFMKDYRGTIRLSAFDLFNQNTGFSSISSASSITESHVNRLARYYLLTFTLRLEKFAGKRPTEGPGMHRFRRDRGPGGVPGRIPE